MRSDVIGLKNKFPDFCLLNKNNMDSAFDPVLTDPLFCEGVVIQC